jgi:hypothetical protein
LRQEPARLLHHGLSQEEVHQDSQLLPVGALRTFPAGISIYRIHFDKCTTRQCNIGLIFFKSVSNCAEVVSPNSQNLSFCRAAFSTYRASFGSNLRRARCRAFQKASGWEQVAAPQPTGRIARWTKKTSLHYRTTLLENFSL